MLIQRVITGAIFGIVVIAGVLLLPTSGTAALLALLFVAGAWEWAGLARLTAPLRAASAALLAAVALLGYAWTGERSVVIPLLLVAAAFWAVALAAVLSFPRRLPLAAVGAAGVFVLLPPWAALVHLHGATPKGPGLVMAVIAIVWAADVGAFFTGRAIGRHKLAPQVSPGKTWEGVAGGIALSALVSAVAAALVDVPVGSFVAVGAVTALVSVLGDLTVSVAKRNIGVKDSGRLLPGHGGMLDRIDSLTAAAPIFVLGLLAAGLI